MLFTSAVQLHPPHAHLTVGGELDVLSSRSMRREVDGVLADENTDFTVDASRVTFVDAAGLAAFVRLRNAVLARNGHLTFVAASAPFVWVCGMAGLQRAFGLEPN
jgi:anti-anti-sigma factor